MNVLKFGVLLVALTACGTEKVNQCGEDSDCTDIAYPFCDVTGDTGPAGTCTVKPADCPVDRCGCTPGATTCESGVLTTCNADGSSTRDTSCTLGCADSKDRCLAFEPTNGLGAAMLAAADEPDVTIPEGATIDTDAFTISTASGTVAVKSVVVANGSASTKIVAFIAR
ncbi:MAG TPA: hypothetical protein VGC41_12850 [Kofleriaceae bacterium]